MIADTTFLIDLARGDAGARALAQEIERGSEALRVPAPAVAKFWEALERSRRPPREAAALQSLLLGVPGVAFDAAHAVSAARLLAAAAAEGRALDPFDAMVAAIAIAEDEELVTRNTGEFARISNLRTRGY